MKISDGNNERIKANNVNASLILIRFNAFYIFKSHPCALAEPKQRENRHKL